MVIRPSHGYGWGGAEDSPEDEYLLREAPYRWLFPQMAAIIHHGGAGTTAEALLAGVPNAVVAFGVDQPYHGRRIHELGAGPAPIKRSKLIVNRLASSSPSTRPGSVIPAERSSTVVVVVILREVSIPARVTDFQGAGASHQVGRQGRYSRQYTT